MLNVKCFKIICQLSNVSLKPKRSRRDLCILNTVCGLALRGGDNDGVHCDELDSSERADRLLGRMLARVGDCEFSWRGLRSSFAIVTDRIFDDEQDCIPWMLHSAANGVTIDKSSSSESSGGLS